MRVRLPNELPTDQANREVLRALAGLEGEELKGLLVIVEVVGHAFGVRPPDRLFREVRHASSGSGLAASGFSRSNDHRAGLSAMYLRIRWSDSSLRMTCS